MSGEGHFKAPDFDQMVKEIMGKHGITLVPGDPALVVVEAAALVLRHYIEYLEQRVPLTHESLRDFRVSISGSLAQMTERLVSTIGTLASGGSDPQKQIELLGQINNQFAEDMNHIGSEVQKLQNAQTSSTEQFMRALDQFTVANRRTEELLVQIEKVSSKASGSRPKYRGILLGFGIAIAIVIAGYYAFGIDKLVDYGRTFQKVWPQLDEPTRNKITNVLRTPR